MLRPLRLLRWSRILVIFLFFHSSWGLRLFECLLLNRNCGWSCPLSTTNTNEFRKQKFARKPPSIVHTAIGFICVCCWLPPWRLLPLQIHRHHHRCSRRSLPLWLLVYFSVAAESEMGNSISYNAYCTHCTRIYLAFGFGYSSFASCIRRWWGLTFFLFSTLELGFIWPILRQQKTKSVRDVCAYRNVGSNSGVGFRCRARSFGCDIANATKNAARYRVTTTTTTTAIYADVWVIRMNGRISQMHTHIAQPFSTSSETKATSKVQLVCCCSTPTDASRWFSASQSTYSFNRRTKRKEKKSQTEKNSIININCNAIFNRV